MRLQAGVRHLRIDGREELQLDLRPVRGVDHHRGVDALEQAIVDHDLLAGEILLRGRAYEHDLAAPLIAGRGQGDRGADPGRGDQVVAAAVAQAAERVVFREDRDGRRVFLSRLLSRESARIAVSRLPAGRSTAYPCRASVSATRADDSRSSNPGSGCACIQCARSTISVRFAATAAAIDVITGSPAVAVLICRGPSCRGIVARVPEGSSGLDAASAGQVRIVR